MAGMWLKSESPSMHFSEKVEGGGRMAACGIPINGEIMRLYGTELREQKKCSRCEKVLKAQRRKRKRISTLKAEGRLPVKKIPIKAMKIDNPVDPVGYAESILSPRAKSDHNGSWRLDGKPTTIQAVIRAANDVLAAYGKPGIKYPGVDLIF